MNTDNAGGDEPPDDADEPEPETLDEAIAADVELARPAMELARQTAEAMRPVQDMMQAHAHTYRFALEALNSPGMRAAMDAAVRQQKLVQDITNTPAIRLATELANSPAARLAKELANSPAARLARELADSPAARLARDLANSPAARLAAELADTWQRFQSHTADRMTEAIQSIQSASKQIWPWISTVADSVGKTIGTIYRQAAPPNWTNGDATPLVSYTAAVALALEEGIPLAWVPDHDTVRMLLAVPAGTDRRTALRAVLTDRRGAILDHCEERLDRLASDPDASADRHRMIDVARQSIQALRADLPAPAQSAAANLADHLLRRLFVPLDGKYAYKATSNRVTSLSDQISGASLSFLMVLREFATLMPVPKSLTEWWPNKDMPLPDTFSRHATAHAIAEPDQVNPVNALIAVMLAVSLLCQEIASGWTALGTFVWNPEDDETDDETDEDTGSSAAG